MDKIESRARELLAAEYSDDPTMAGLIRRGEISSEQSRRGVLAIAAALRESEEWRRDAERYRYVRREDAWKEDYLSVRGGISAVFVSDGRCGHATHGDALDAAIDAARKEGV